VEKWFRTVTAVKAAAEHATREHGGAVSGLAELDAEAVRIREINEAAKGLVETVEAPRPSIDPAKLEEVSREFMQGRSVRLSDLLAELKAGKKLGDVVGGLRD